jgi:hypothetical protein
MSVLGLLLGIHFPVDEPDELKSTDEPVRSETADERETTYTVLHRLMYVTDF